MARLQSDSVQKRQLRVWTGLRANTLAILAEELVVLVIAHDGTLAARPTQKIKMLTC
jgi:hypothetical protein